MTPDRSTFRRRELGGVLGAVGLLTLPGCFADEDADEQATRSENQVIVGPNSKYVYEPETMTVDVGETVTWTWDSNNHNVVVDEQPADADWEGTDGGASETYDEGYAYEYTFDVPGTYSYYCSPHEGMGMIAEVVVES